MKRLRKRGYSCVVPLTLAQIPANLRNQDLSCVSDIVLESDSNQLIHRSTGVFVKYGPRRVFIGDIWRRIIRRITGDYDLCGGCIHRRPQRVKDERDRIMPRYGQE